MTRERIGETQIVSAFLDQQRDVVLWKLAGLSDDQLREPIDGTPSITWRLSGKLSASRALTTLATCRGVMDELADPKRIVADSYDRMGPEFLAWNSARAPDVRRWFVEGTGWLRFDAGCRFAAP